MHRPVRLAALALFVAACATDTEPAFQADPLLAHIKALSADSMEGRGPGRPGEERTIRYLVAQFKAMGLQPGNPDGSWTQPVEMVGFTATPSLEFSVKGKTLPMTFRDDYVAVSRRTTAPQIDVVKAPLVFVGYGTVAPEYGWDDYKGVDVKGKTVVMLVNDPPVRLASDTAALDDAMFRGKAMTYYGRWTYKYEIASAKGAAAVILVHQTGPAGYPWEVVTGSWGSENVDVRHADGNIGRVAVESWMTEAKARALFAAAGQDFDALQAKARTKAFAPVDLGGTATFHITNALRDLTSHNVIAKLEGSDAALKNEYVIYSAHWDHLGIGQPVNGDSIFNGAIDNASGTAAVLEIAKAFTAGKPRPKRTVLFLIVTAEEKGLLGARYYAQHPLYPLTKTLANINIDGINQWGKTSDLTVIGLGNSTLDDVLGTLVKAKGRTLSPDAEPEKGFFFRSDHFEFAKEGVPALYTESGTHFIGKPDDYGKKKRDEYTEKDYHKPSDEVKPDWDLSGGLEDIALLYHVGLDVANAAAWPTWKPGTEFKAVREKSLAGPK